MRWSETKSESGRRCICGFCQRFCQRDWQTCHRVLFRFVFTHKSFFPLTLCVRPPVISVMMEEKSDLSHLGIWKLLITSLRHFLRTHKQVMIFIKCLLFPIRLIFLQLLCVCNPSGDCENVSCRLPCLSLSSVNTKEDLLWNVLFCVHKQKSMEVEKCSFFTGFVIRW